MDKKSRSTRLLRLTDQDLQQGEVKPLLLL